MSDQEGSHVSTSLANVKHIILVLSGKGGVGKSTVACQLAFALANVHGKSVGLLDVDICGPSVPTICGVVGRDIYRGENGWEPVSLRNGQPREDEDAPEVGDIKIMSIAFLLPSERDAVVWRGPKKDAMIRQFLTDVHWGALDYLVIDTPPGTSDEHLTLCEMLKPFSMTGAVIVTTPQDVATDDVKKELSLCHKLGLRCLGIVENMSGFACPHCSHCTDIFSTGGGKRLAEAYEVEFLGSIPIDPMLSLAEDKGQCFITASGDRSGANVSQTVTAVVGVIGAIMKQADKAAELQRPT
uniref:Cytosolic Fe-S cluster assembly factor NUBP2 homolog n=1 Tax=Trypanosoma congolense (strain IL3000) TaxID=1068625 RepID=G0UPI9_TRYCI|nr:putative nucleotide binding protein [Trypanosoma congolense IL3000]